MSDEQILLQSDKVFRWDGPKRKQTLLKAKLGRLVLTNQRLVFLSTGKNDITVGRVVAGGLGNAALGLRTSSTQGLDMSAADAPGGMSIPVERLRSAELKGMFKTLTVVWSDESGAEQAATFAPKNGGMPDGGTWIASLEKARTGGYGAGGAG
jgi:hypothetical protein